MPLIDERRRRTLETLVELAIADDAASCYDGAKAERLLRSQTTREELASIGVDRLILERLWPSNE